MAQPCVSLLSRLQDEQAPGLLQGTGRRAQPVAVLAWALFCFVLYHTEAQDGLPHAEQKNKLC